MRSTLEDVITNKKMFSYSSDQDLISKEDLYKYLKSIKVFDKNLNEFTGKTINEIKIS